MDNTRVGFLPYNEFLNRYYGRTSMVPAPGQGDTITEYVPFDYSKYVQPDFSSYTGPVNLEEYYKQYLGQTIPMSGVYQTTDPGMLGYSSPDAGITALPQVQEQAQVVQDADTSFGDIQTHFDQNQMLKEAVAKGDITPEQYNELGGYDVTQTIAGGNPLLGGIANLIGSVPYNIYQSIKGDQPFSDIPGDVYRNIKGGLGFISPDLKSRYNQFIQKAQQTSPTVAQNISETVSNYNPFQQQQYIQYAAQNPEQAQAAAQRAQSFVEATQRNK